MSDQSISRLLSALTVMAFPASGLASSLDAGASICAAGMAVSETPRPDLLYGDRLSFEVRRNGDRVGRHETRFTLENGQLRAISETRIKVKVLFVTAYSFSYEGVSAWCNGTMTAFAADVNNNGKQREIRATLDEGGYRITGADGRLQVEGPLYATEHWNPAILDSDRILNGVNGRLAKVEISDLGEEMVDIKDGQIAARHYSYRGDLSTDVWYDRAGRWVKMRFVTKKDQSVIEYICETCKPDATLASSTP